MTRFIIMPVLGAIATLALLSACAVSPSLSVSRATQPTLPAAIEGPFMAQVVGVQWFNPLQRRDYTTEWQLLWTLGLAKPNQDDDMLRKKPAKYSSLQVIGPVVGAQSLAGLHRMYVKELASKLYDPYFQSSKYFYNAHSREDKSTWRELAGIHIEYALPDSRLDPAEAAKVTRDRLIDIFAIGNKNFPTAWTRDTPPDVRVTPGGPNAGFRSLSAALDHLKSHPDETVWAMSWDAPSFPAKEDQLNENMVLLVLAGPQYKTGRAPLAWIGYPATHNAAQYQKKAGLPPRVLQAWQAAVRDAAANAGKEAMDIGYAIHDANMGPVEISYRVGNLAQTLLHEVPEFDFNKQQFNTPSLLGEMGAATALTNIALGIAYANHVGKNVLVAGTTDPDGATAVLVVPPATVRPIEPAKPWYRARSEANAYLMWWGMRDGQQPHMQGYSE